MTQGAATRLIRWLSIFALLCGLLNASRSDGNSPISLYGAPDCKIGVTTRMCAYDVANDRTTPTQFSMKGDLPSTCGYDADTRLTGHSEDARSYADSFARESPVIPILGPETNVAHGYDPAPQFKLTLGRMGVRYYDPRLGRWLSRDPMGEAGGFNLYAYCGNDPVNRHDALGMAWSNDFGDFEKALGSIGRIAGTTAVAAPSAVIDLAADFVAVIGGGTLGPSVGMDQIGDPLDRTFHWRQNVWDAWGYNGPQWTRDGRIRTATASQDVVFALSGAFQAPKVTAPPFVPDIRNPVTSPSAAMRANANFRGTYVDPLTGNPVPASGSLPADHIVPQSWIRAQAGFETLAIEQQNWLLNHPLNTQPLPRTFNSSKGAQMPGDWQTYKGQSLDPSYILTDAQRAQFLQNFIQQQIRDFNQGKK